ncbi:MAG: hypothetical protein JWP46_1413 [Modestobacter sp.]|nr:hypothetical protein [Modestobacter sp.]
MPISLRGSPSETRGDERNAQLLDQRNGPDAVMALGLGFAAANRRRDRIDVVNRAADRDDARADQQDAQSATDMTDHARPDLPTRHS